MCMQLADTFVKGGATLGQMKRFQLPEMVESYLETFGS